MKILTPDDLQKRIAQAACKLECENIALAKQGKKSKDNENALFEMMFMYTFIQGWSSTQLRQKECLLNDNYGV